MAQIGVLQRPSPPGNHDRFAIELSHVKKSYGPNAYSEIYTDLHFQLLRGTFVALEGPIGSGKTTMLNLFAGIERRSAGSLVGQGQEMSGLDEETLAAYRS